jgi:deazaflavin-dependent oxidoreductase (nitroreductase family)
VVPPRGTRGSELPGFVRALMRVMQGPYHLAFRRFGDRWRVQGRPLIELETVGAKTGTPRHVVIGSFPEIAASPSSWVVVASNSGSARHPAWFLNLAKNQTRRGSCAATAGSRSLLRLSRAPSATERGKR